MTLPSRDFPTPSIVRVKLTLAYRGTLYHGWQRQEVPPTWKGQTEPDKGLPTIQETLEEAVRQVVRHPIHIVGSSRTDAGVHAKAQVAHFDTDKSQIPPLGFRRAINSRLPPDICVTGLEYVDSSFDAISSTVSKRYQYLVWTAPDRNPMLADLANHRWRSLDLDAMRQAAADFVGTHDFVSFAKVGHGRESTIRTVYGCNVSRRGNYLVIGVHGSGFLWNQVRIMAGTLLEIGQGDLNVDTVKWALKGQDRRIAGRTAPAHGLYLQWIRYGRSDCNKLSETVDR